MIYVKFHLKMDIDNNIADRVYQKSIASTQDNDKYLTNWIWQLFTVLWISGQFSFRWYTLPTFETRRKFQ